METRITGTAREVIIGDNRPTALIGERINPTGKKKLAAALQAGDMELVVSEAVAQVKKALALAPNSFPAYRQLLFIYAEMGREDEARAAAEEMMRINPKFSVDGYAKTLPYKDQEYCKRWVEALRKAGLK